MHTLAHARSTAVALAASLLLILGVTGCGGGDGLNRQAVSGSVTMGGEPLESGFIAFVPSDPNLPTQGGTAIVDGEYSLPGAQGLVPGKYKVVISSSAGKDTAGEKPVEDLDALGPGMPPIPAQEAIPDQFGSDSVLEANVTDGGANRFDFAIGKAGK